jgi:hypothetical protein
MHWIDPDFLPDVRGVVERFIVNPHGEIDGFLLAYDTDRFVLVHVPPHLEQELEAAIAPGDTVRVRGVRPRGADIIAAVSLTANDGRLIVDNDPGVVPKTAHRGGEPSMMAVAGTVRLPLFGPKGELRGALLDDGTIVRIGPKEAAQFAELLRPHRSIAARGGGLETKHGTVVSAKEIGSDWSDLRPVSKPAPKREHEPAAPASAPSVA